MKHCIVTMEIAGPTKTGGIGTHCFYLAKFLRERFGHEVTLLLTAPLAHGDSPSWKKYFKELMKKRKANETDIERKLRELFEIEDKEH